LIREIDIVRKDESYVVWDEMVELMKVGDLRESWGCERKRMDERMRGRGHGNEFQNLTGGRCDGIIRLKVEGCTTS